MSGPVPVQVMGGHGLVGMQGPPPGMMNAGPPPGVIMQQGPPPGMGRMPGPGGPMPFGKVELLTRFHTNLFILSHLIFPLFHV